MKKPKKHKPKLEGAVRVRIQRDVTHFVRQWRKYRDMGIVDLAERAGVSASMISQLETGKANYTQVTLERLAEALQVHPAALLWTDPEAEPLSWCTLLRGWRDACDMEPGMFDVLLDGHLKAALNSARMLQKWRPG